MSIEYRSIRTRHTAAETSTINDNVPLPAPAGAVAPLKTSCARTGGQTPNCSALAGSRRVQHISHCRSTRLARPHPPRVLASAPPHITHKSQRMRLPSLSHTHALACARATDYHSCSSLPPCRPEHPLATKAPVPVPMRNVRGRTLLAYLLSVSLPHLSRPFLLLLCVPVSPI
jgi:hypothetical protein